MKPKKQDPVKTREKIDKITENMSLLVHWANHCKKMQLKFAGKTMLSPSGSNLKQTQPYWSDTLEQARNAYKVMIDNRRKLIDSLDKQ